MILSFFYLFVLCTNHCLSDTSVNKFDFDIPPPPGLVSHFLVFIHFFIFSSPLTLPDLLQPAVFTFLLFCLCGFPAVAVQVSWTEGVLCPVRYSS